MFYEDDDVILPDDFDNSDDTPTDEGFESEEEQDSFEEVEPAAEGEELSEEENLAFLKVKYNGEEQDLDEATARQYAQMGMNYEKVNSAYQELQNDPRLAFVNELAKENGYDNVHEFVEEFRAMQEQSQLDELIQNNIPEEYAREMIENKKFREQFNKQQQQEQQQQAEMREYQDFFDAFRQANDRDFNPEKDQIPQEVLDIRDQKQVPLRYAFMEFNQQQMKNQMAIYKQNESNGKKATIKGGITKHGSGDDPIDDFLAGFDSDNGW